MAAQEEIWKRKSADSFNNLFSLANEQLRGNNHKGFPHALQQKCYLSVLSKCFPKGLPLTALSKCCLDSKIFQSALKVLFGSDTFNLAFHHLENALSKWPESVAFWCLGHQKAFKSIQQQRFFFTPFFISPISLQPTLPSEPLRKWELQSSVMLAWPWSCRCLGNLLPSMQQLLQVGRQLMSCCVWMYFCISGLQPWFLPSHLCLSAGILLHLACSRLHHCFCVSTCFFECSLLKVCMVLGPFGFALDLPFLYFLNLSKKNSKGLLSKRWPSSKSSKCYHWNENVLALSLTQSEHPSFSLSLCVKPQLAKTWWQCISLSLSLSLKVHLSLTRSAFFQTTNH